MLRAHADRLQIGWGCTTRLFQLFCPDCEMFSFQGFISSVSLAFQDPDFISGSWGGGGVEQTVLHAARFYFFVSNFDTVYFEILINVLNQSIKYSFGTGMVSV